MTMSRDEMMTLVIRRYGFEHEKTICFAQAIIDQMDRTALEDLFKEVMADSIEEEA